MVFKVELLDCLVNNISDVVGADTLDQSVELECLLDGQDWEDGIMLRAVADASLLVILLHHQSPES